VVGRGARIVVVHRLECAEFLRKVRKGNGIEPYCKLFARRWRLPCTRIFYTKIFNGNFEVVFLCPFLQLFAWLLNASVRNGTTFHAKTAMKSSLDSLSRAPYWEEGETSQYVPCRDVHTAQKTHSLACRLELMDKETDGQTNSVECHA